MADLNLEKLKPGAAKVVASFINDVLIKYSGMHSIHVTGTAITDDFDEKVSDINSIFVLKTMDLKFLELLVPVGKQYRKHKIAAPLIMTPEYIKTSLDVFPIEFLNFRLLHSTVYGEDILKDLDINRMDLRHQCERDLKTKLIWLRQGYLSSLGDRKMLTEGFVSSITGYIPLFRGIIFLLGKEPPLRHGEVITELSRSAHVNTDVFARVLKEKHEKIKLTMDELHSIFEEYYAAAEKLGKIVDEIKE